MDGARGLSPAEHIQQPGPGSVHAGAHGEAGQDDQRKEDEEDREIAQLLQRRVGPPMVEAEARMVHDVTR